MYYIPFGDHKIHHKSAPSVFLDNYSKMMKMMMRLAFAKRQRPLLRRQLPMTQPDTKQLARLAFVRTLNTPVVTHSELKKMLMAWNWCPYYVLLFATRRPRLFLLTLPANWVPVRGLQF